MGMDLEQPRRAREPAARRWRDYRTAAGVRPVRDFLLGLSAADAAAVLAAMVAVRVQGLRAARHLTGDIYEVRADGDRQTFCMLFANEGKSGQILMSQEGFSEKTRKTPPERIRLAERRLSDWRRRGRRGS